MKKAMQLASVASMIDQFNRSNIDILLSLGYSVDVVADFTNPGNITIEKAAKLKTQLNDLGVRVFDIAIPRSLNPKKIIDSYKCIEELLRAEHYDVLHCHSPIGSAIARTAAKRYRKNGLKVIYTAHGFHFFNGAPLINWVVYYPIEKLLSRYTDVLITINQEDFQRATDKFYANKTIKIPGVGVDTKRYSDTDANRLLIRQQKRDEFGFRSNDFVVISVGELNDNKNHQVVIDAISQLPDNVKYVVVGKGALEQRLYDSAVRLGVADRVIFTGYRTDVKDLLWMSDCFAFPSKREGLGLAAIEGMASGLPVVASPIGGIKDYLSDNTGIACPNNTSSEYSLAIKRIMESNDQIDYSKNCINEAQKYDSTVTERIMRRIYEELL